MNTEHWHFNYRFALSLDMPNVTLGISRLDAKTSLRGLSAVQGRSSYGDMGRNSQKPDIYKRFAAVKCFSR